MVTTTNEHDDLPTHDIHGTDLRRVRSLLKTGCSPRLIAEVLGLDLWLARYAVVVATGDREGSPDPQEIEARVAEVQSGWTEDQAYAARFGLPRNSSRSVTPRPYRMHSPMQSLERRIESGDVRAERVDHADGTVSYRITLQFERSGRRRHVRRLFATREQAEQFGIEWLKSQLKAWQAEACSAVG